MRTIPEEDSYDADIYEWEAFNQYCDDNGIGEDINNSNEDWLFSWNIWKSAIITVLKL